MHEVLSECVDAWWGEELPRESWSINNSCVIHVLSLMRREGDARNERWQESETEGHRVMGE